MGSFFSSLTTTGPLGTVPIHRPSMVLLVLSALLGMLFCLANALGAELLCVSSGCSIYAGYSVLGLSVNFLGAVAFAVVLLAALIALYLQSGRFYLYLILLSVLVLDSLFLIWQILFWPCTSCLFVALMFLLCVIGAAGAFAELRRKALAVVVVFWFAAFLPVAVAAGKELLVRPWAAFGPENGPIAVYFSPTCPACRSAVLDLLDMTSVRDQVAFYPVAKNAEDLKRLAVMNRIGGEAGLRQLFADVPEDMVAPVTWSLRFKLARNNMATARMGVTRVPTILTSQLIQASPNIAPMQEPGSWLPRNLFISPTLEAGCSLTAGDAVPCD